MRRISLALALVGAMAATGCGTGSTGAAKAGTAPGVAEGTFRITVQNGQGQTRNATTGVLPLELRGGVVTSTPAGIECGEGVAVQRCEAEFPVGTAVTMTATAIAPKQFLQWSGDCQGTGPCSFSGGADRYLVASFGTYAEQGAHPNWSAAADHGAQYRAWKADPVAYGFACTQCHGADLRGVGIAVSCYGCHAHPQLRGPGVDGAFANGPEVTTECVKCHAKEASDFMQTQHWTWKGPTPELQALSDFQLRDPLALADASGAGTIGKVNLVNNFCVSLASNEKRCDQCHAGYGTTVSARAPANATDATRVDCLICHSALVRGNMTGGYQKVPGNFGAAGGTAPLKDSANAIVGSPTRDNCGFCHFNGGGADSVKILSTSLVNPAAAVDVHMTGSGANLTCASCHADANHRVKGAGVHTPTNTARTSCEECHGAAPHADAGLNGHTDVLACQTCHIPAYSRGQPGKIDWDWATAGNKGAGTGAAPPAGLSVGTIYGCLDVATNATTDLGAGNYANGCPAGTVKVKMYDYMKGHFAWGIHVKPTYRWYDGRMTHVTTLDKGALTAPETGLTPDARITLSAPIGSASDPKAKIFPFKLMTGRQPVYVDGDRSFIITPKLFAAAGDTNAFWGVTGSPGYVYTPAGGETVSQGTWVSTASPTPTPIETTFSTAFRNGSVAAGQLDVSATMTRFDGTTGWDWRYTKMYMDLNHEVAPKAQALACAMCHSDAPAIDWTQLGYACANPMSCPKRP
jgi:hypothetical protein